MEDDMELSTVDFNESKLNDFVPFDAIPESLEASDAQLLKIEIIEDPEDFKNECEEPQASDDESEDLTFQHSNEQFSTETEIGTNRFDPQTCPHCNGLFRDVRSL